jgi:RimJ/RimL family protein N-acetyltransferase
VIDLPLVTPRLVIDALVETDAVDVAGYRSDPDVARYQGWSAPYPVEQAAALAGTGQLALRLDGKLVGDAMVAPAEAAAHAAEMGVTLAPHAQGRGLATEAVTALVDAVFARGRIKAIAYVDARNEASLHLFDRVGFRREGHLHHSFVGPDGPVDEVLFGLTADVWRHPTGELIAELEPHPADIARLDHAIYEFNVGAVGVDDGTELAVFDRDELGRIAGGAAGVAWCGGAELWLLWVREDRRGTGLGRRLLAAFEEAARQRGARRVFVASHTFQAPGFYRRLGYEVAGRWEGWPAGHADVFLQKDL